MDSKKEVKVKGKLTLEDYKKLTSYYMGRLSKQMLIVVYLLFLGVYGIIFYKRYGIPFVLIAGVFGTLVVYLALYIATRQRIKKTFKKDTALNNDFVYTINKKGVHVQSERGGDIYYWKDITEATNHKDLYILNIPKVKTILIPKNFFGDEDETEAFKKIVANNIKGKNNIE
ncbi:YcxB family protein [Clostridium sp. 'White wine YQ']|uniref:YcxB family protein n=1 Tax=Clostridium sp. 'White wine YQ' TaxID=3027474 RepID=UPI00236630B3|nr:YcxB family protein [Clostridium sp. 'White wine YQ']MDD7793174.1 YcxB family protein [Clostridium sp. 'White wine YQ']